jgi:T5SS/PEP-CTERM-associated repeat protein
MVIVDGEGSSWTNSGKLNVGLGVDEVPGGTGTVSISDGGTVSASVVSIGGSSILTTDLGYGSSLTVGSGSGDITNNGTLRLVAGAGAASGTYTPMSYGTLSGNDAQVLGGVWDSVNHTVTVSDAELALAGRAKTIDLATTQRLLFVDAATGRIAGASFMASDSPLKFTASVMGESELSLLQTSLESGEEILVGWDFLAIGSGYAEGDPVYLSLEIGCGYDLSDLAIWLFDESTWTEYDASDLAYDETYASFTVTDFSGYAVTATSSVPIPGAVWLLGSGLLGLIGIRRRSKNSHI